MASLKKITIIRYLDAERRRVPNGTPGAKKVKEPSTAWYGQYKARATGKWVRVPLFTDQRASAARLGELVTADERGEVGMVDERKESREADIEQHVAAPGGDGAVPGSRSGLGNRRREAS
jgi:hypothetical protein